MAFWRHLRLYLWKNGLQKVRNPSISCCELLTPIVLVSLFAILYYAANTTDTPTTTYECNFDGSTGNKFDFAYLPRALNKSVLKLGIVGPEPVVTRFTNHLEANYPGLEDSGLLLSTLNCSGLQLDVAVQKSLPFFPGFSSAYYRTFATEADLETYISLEDYGNSPDVPGIWAAVVFTVSEGNQWAYKIRANATDIFDTHTERDDYRRGNSANFITQYMYSDAFNYGTAGEKPYLPFPQPGFIPLQTAVDKFIIGRRSAPANSSVLESNDLLAFAADWGCVNGLPLFNASSAASIAVSTLLRSHQLLPQHVTLAPFPVSEYRSDDFYTFVSNVFALIFVLSFFFPSFFLIRGVVVEKEAKLREGMRMMGLADAALFTAWYVTYGALFMVIAVVIAIITGSTFFSHSDGGLLFLYFFIFGLTAMALCVLLSAFFSKAKLAAAVGAVVFIATFFPYFAVNDPLKSDASKVAASFLSPVAFGLALDIISQLEANGVGVNWHNLYTPLNGSYSFGTALGLMLIDFGLYTVLALYLGNVLPQEFGVPLPWYYPCSPRWLKATWAGCTCRCGRGGQGAGTSGKAGSNAESLLGSAGAAAAAAHHHATGTATADAESDGLLSAHWADRFDSIGIAAGDNVEPPGLALRELAREGRCVSVRGLSKLFPTPDGIKPAVDGVDLDVFEGQIFGLLGHNGAGKTTTISMLTGLIPPSSGDAYVYGHPISSEMAEVRTSLGVCPQHDVLWPDLTVREHLAFFAGIKGMPAKAIPEAVSAMIREVGLTEKVETRSAELSGGQKRKLSVGIALIAGSRVVVLDEPTSGMDPWSRRFTWNVVQSNKAGRIIMLTTHFLEEADILCDRVAIMSNGRIRCCGTSMYLKALFGVGYNLTVVKAAGCDSEALEGVVRRHLLTPEGGVALPHQEVPYRVLSNVGSEMSFQIPFASSPAFPALFRELEACTVATDEGAAGATAATAVAASSSPATPSASRVRIATYGVSVTTLEEVFLRVAEEGAEAAAADKAAAAALAVEKEHRDAPSAHAAVSSAVEPAKAVAAAAAKGSLNAAPPATHAGPADGGHGAFFGGSDEYSRAQSVGAGGIFWRHFTALFCKRWRYALRDRRAMLFQLLIPVAALLLGLALLHQVTSATWPEVPLSLSAYNTGIPPTAPGGAPPNFVPVLSSSPLGAQVIGNVTSAGSVPTNAINPFYVPAVQGATFIPVPLPYLAGAYNYSAYDGWGACSFNDPNAAMFLVNQSELAALSYPWYSLNDTWMLSEYLLDSKNGSAPWLPAPVPTDAERASALARRLRAGDAALRPSASVSAAALGGIVQQGGASRYGAYVLNDLQVGPDGSTPVYAAYTALINTTALIGAPTFVAAMHSGLYNWAHGGQNASISVVNAPLPFTRRQGVIINSLLSFVAVLFIVVAFSFIPASFAVFIVKEAEVKAKHQQLISGVSMPAYWLATYCWDIINYCVPCFIAVVLVVAFDVSELVGPSLGATILLFVSYGTAVAPFTYVLSYAFKSHSTAQIMTLIINLLCVILLLASFVMQQISATCPADSYLRFAYRLLPGYALGNGLIQLSLLKELPFLESNCGQLSVLERVMRTYTPFSLEAAGYPILYMLAESLVYFALAVGIDVLLSYPVIKARLLPDKDVQDKPYEEDDDVVAEAARVDAGRAASDTIVLQHLRKVYAGGKLAVKNLTFGVPQGEVFGFLGINGAGKTTTLKMLSGDEIPTHGTAHLGGFDILREQIEVRRLLGYCPQFDALLDLLTTREHLELYARIKGVPERLLSGVVDAKLREMDLLQYSNKLAGSLSGGNKRKLSVAIAMIGDPPLMFLDEPSTGMDPVARRFMWNVISRIATERRQCSIILTTHSMEECEALATRVGIMVGGRLRCLGSTQHLKDKFGQGYLAIVKLRHPSTEKVQAVMRHLQPFLLESAAGVWKVQAARVREICEALGDPTRARMLHPSGSGWALAAALAREGLVDAAQFAEWWASESYGAALHAFVTSSFPGSTLSERHGEFFSYRVLANTATTRLSSIFAVFESNKGALQVAEYSLSQTSLEQIFNSMAAQQEEEAGPTRGLATTVVEPVRTEAPVVLTAASALPAAASVTARRSPSFAAKVFGGAQGRPGLDKDKRPSINGLELRSPSDASAMFPPDA